MTNTKAPIPKVIVLSETDGRPYYAALEKLKVDKRITLIYRESSCLRLLAHDCLRKGLHIRHFKKCARNFWFRLTAWRLTGAIIINGMGPFDFRVFFYGKLARRNVFINHTSWHGWHTDEVPRKYGPLTHLARLAWHRHLRLECHEVICTLQEVKESLAQFCPAVSTKTRVIPHSVDFSASQRALSPVIDNSSFRSTDSGHPAHLSHVVTARAELRPLRMLYVGKLIPEKGIAELFVIMRSLAGTPAVLTIVGDGPLRPYVESEVFKTKGVKYLGRVDNRQVLSSLFQDHDILLVPSLRTPTWEELFGIVVIEGMYSGLCVLASNHVGPRHLITDGHNGYILPEHSPQRWVEVIASLSADRPLLTKIADQAMADALRYRTTVVAEEWAKTLTLHARGQRKGF